MADQGLATRTRQRSSTGIFAALVFAGLLVHSCMVAVSPEERPGLRGMFTGHVPADYARHHHGLCVEMLEKDEAGPK